MTLPILSALALCACAGLGGGGSGGGYREPAPPSSAELGPEDLGWLEEVRHPDHLPPLDPGQEVELARSLLDLRREDFGLFSAALRRIAELGEPVVPYLGFVDDRDTPPDASERSRTTPPVRILLKQVLHEIPSENVGRHLESPYRGVRVAAATVAGERRQTEFASQLVVLLDDPDLDVRRSAIVSLRMISKRFFGYQPGVSERRRREAVQRWREFWAVAADRGV